MTRTPQALRTLLPAVALLAAALGAQAPRRPDILFLFADDLRPDAVGAFGNQNVRTPNLDRIADRGFRFASNYCMGSIHGAVCQPSRAMLNSGRTLYRVPMNLKGVPTLGEVLRRAGYLTFGTGKWHNGRASFSRSFERGRAVMFAGMSDHLKVPVQDLKADGSFTPRRTGAKFSSELFADAAVDFLGTLKAQGERPFFAYVSFTAPHDPRQPPLSYRRWYYQHRPPLPRNFMPQHPFQNGWLTGRDETLAPWPRTRAVVSDQLCEYYGLITHMDAQIGRVLAALGKSGRLGNTLIVFSADHGLAVGSHGLLGKQSVYEHSMGCPLVFAGPGVPRGSSTTLTYLLDVMPTLLDAAGLKAPHGVEGHSLRPVWRGARSRVRDSLYLTYEDKMRAVRDERFKLIRYPPSGHVQLFDLREDPDELVNLAGDARHTARRAALQALLERWHGEIADPHPLVREKPVPLSVDLRGRKRKPDRHQPAWIVEKYFRHR